MMVEIATNESFNISRRLRGPAALADSDYTAKLDIADLPADQRTPYRVIFEDLAEPRSKSEPVAGSFMTAPTNGRQSNLAPSAGL